MQGVIGCITLSRTPMIPDDFVKTVYRIFRDSTPAVKPRGGKKWL
jgi:hypothetical protein